jgi:hypothetical protein
MTLDDVYIDLLAIVSEVGARPDLSTGADKFFEGIIGSFSGSKEELLAYVREHLKSWFCCASEYPAWFQAEEWQYNNGKPMMYIGHTDMPAASYRFETDTRFFVFWDPESGETRTVIQSM